MQLADGTRRDFHPAAQVRVTRNGQDGALSALRPGDQVIVTLDDGDAVTSVDAAEAQESSASGARATQGQVVTAWNAGIAVRVASGVRDYRLADAPRVTRNGTATAYDSAAVRRCRHDDHRRDEPRDGARRDRRAGCGADSHAGRRRGDRRAAVGPVDPRHGWAVYRRTRPKSEI